ncbi:hypothetical protein E2C01_001923 [Portunus trituberculatus]|uniref:Uncharacterized protein n=1 Tax=Portunus trituberculatus TaxID=210409 RepID=A0A5B7CJ68_PORTR|nr:hypothetical protein [Portunus trituberculatus]
MIPVSCESGPLGCSFTTESGPKPASGVVLSGQCTYLNFSRPTESLHLAPSLCRVLHTAAKLLSHPGPSTSIEVYSILTQVLDECLALKCRNVRPFRVRRGRFLFTVLVILS